MSSPCSSRITDRLPHLAQMAPINAEDYGSGDLDKAFARSKSLRIETRPTRALEALGINAEDIVQDLDEDVPQDPFEVGKQRKGEGRK